MQVQHRAQLSASSRCGRIGLQPWPAPWDLKVTSYPACAAGEERSVPTWLGGEIQGHIPDVPAHPRDGEEDVSTRPLLSWRVQGEKNKVASSSGQEKWLSEKGLALTNPEKK